MNQNDINRAFTEKVTELIAQGYQINPATMGGSQGEIGKVDLRKGNDIIRVLLTEDGGFRDDPAHFTLAIGRCTDKITSTVSTGWATPSGTIIWRFSPKSSSPRWPTISSPIWKPAAPLRKSALIAGSCTTSAAARI